MSKHTPGPWNFVQWDKSRPMEFQLVGDRQLTGCKDHLGVRLEKYGPDDTEAEANAHLIAAAPDLLEIAYAARGILEGIVTVIRKVDPTMALEEAQSTTKYLRLINDAIAKAEGK